MNFRVILAVKAEHKNKSGHELCMGLIDHYDKRLETEALWFNGEVYRLLETKDFNDIPNEKIVELFGLEGLIEKKVKSALEYEKSREEIKR